MNKKYTILLVEDSQSIRSITIKILEREFDCIDFIEAIDGADGLKKIKNAHENNSPIDLILTDINMPWLNGNEMIKKWKESNFYSFIPVIMLSAESNYSTIFEMFNYHILDYLNKPFDHQKIIMIIQKAIQAQSCFDETFYNILSIGNIPHLKHLKKVLPNTTFNDHEIVEQFKEALRFSKKEYSLISIDIDKLNLTNALDLLKEIKTKPNLFNTTILLYTSKTITEEYHELFYFNETYIFNKTISENELDHKIKYHLSNGRKNID